MMKKYFLCLAVAILLLVGVSALAETAIPVVTLDGECLNDYANWNDKSTYYPATLTYTDGDSSFTMEIEIKPQGTTSLYAPKKNFTVKFAEGVEFVDTWGAQQKYVLKADYIDPTRSGNVVSAKLAAEMNKKYGVMVDTPNYGVIDGFPVWVKINGEDAGIFSMTIPKDAWLFGMDEANPNHLVLACEGWSTASRMQSAEIDYEADWTFEVGEPTEENKAAFERMVEFVCTADDKTFVEDFDQYLDLDACLNYICFINTAYANDNVAKNMLMVTYDGKVWYPALYDLDSLWGVGYDGTALAEPDGQWSEDLLSNGNCLLFRVNHLFADQVRQRYWELREGILSKENIMASFEAYAAQIPQEYYDIDRALWNADGACIRTFELMGQLMDQYLPLVDQNFTAAAPSDASQIVTGAVVDGPAIHYVWEKDGVQTSNEDIEALPVAMTLSYKLDGNVISVQDLAGKSGQLEVTLHVERKDLDHVYGVTALLHVEEAQCANISITGGTYTKTMQEYVCMGSAWLGGVYNTYEMQLRMDVTNFDPAEYMVAINPVHFDGGDDDGNLEALLATAGELTTIINEGILLHESLTELHGYLTNMQSSLNAASASVKELLPSEGEAAQEDAGSIMQKLLADAETDADAMLTAFGYEIAADADLAQMLSEVAADAERTEEEKAQAAEQLALIEDYQAVLAELEATQQTVGEINENLTTVTTYMPDLVGAYGYANDQLYAILYKISTLYQNLVNYYNANHGGGGDFDFTEYVDWYEVIVFSNYEGITTP